jgi:hypothetical protein
MKTNRKGNDYDDSDEDKELYDVETEREKKT